MNPALIKSSFYFKENAVMSFKQSGAWSRANRPKVFWSNLKGVMFFNFGAKKEVTYFLHETGAG